MPPTPQPDAPRKPDKNKDGRPSFDEFAEAGGRAAKAEGAGMHWGPFMGPWGHGAMSHGGRSGREGREGREGKKGGKGGGDGHGLGPFKVSL